MSAPVAAAGKIITVLPTLLSGRVVPVEGIELDVDALGAVPYIRRHIATELCTRHFSLLLGKSLLADRKANAEQLELDDGSIVSIVLTAITEDQWQVWKKLEEKGAGRDLVMLEEETIMKIGWPCVEQALSQTRVRNVWFMNFCLGHDEAEIIAEALSANTNIKGLSLYNSGIDDDVAVFLAQATQANTSLEEVYMFDNRFGDVGINALNQAQEARKRQGKPIRLHV